MLSLLHNIVKPQTHWLNILGKWLSDMGY